MFVVHVVGPRVNAIFHRDKVGDAIEKANQMTADGSVSIEDPNGKLYVPDQFVSLRSAWPSSRRIR